MVELESVRQQEHSDILTSPSDVTDRSDRKGLKGLRWFKELRLLMGLRWLKG